MSLWSAIYALAEPYWQTRANEIHVPGVLRDRAAAARGAPRGGPGRSCSRRSCCTTAATPSCPRRTTTRGWRARRIGWERRHHAPPRDRGRADRGRDPRRGRLRPGADRARGQEIVDGHDSRPEALSLEDAIVKDADKLWRFTESGVRVCHGGWTARPRIHGLRGVADRRLVLHRRRAKALAREALAEARGARPGHRRRPRGLGRAFAARLRASGATRSSRPTSTRRRRPTTRAAGRRRRDRPRRRRRRRRVRRGDGRRGRRRLGGSTSS